MKIIVNGQTREFSDDTTVAMALKDLSLDGKVMAAAINMEVVKQDNWDKCQLKDGDKLELLDFVGGG